MASFSAGTTFTDGVANDVTAAKLAALVNAATPTSGFIQDRTSESAIAADDTLLFGDFSDSSNLKRMTVANFRSAATFGTTTSTAATITSGTITNLASTTGTIATLNSTTGTIGTLNSTTGTIGTINSTTGTITTGVIPTLTSTTLITTGTGTAAAPAIVPTGDSNTGVFFPAADTIAVTTTGTERLRIDSSGNVGIGKTPNNKLDIFAAANTGITISNGTMTAIFANSVDTSIVVGTQTTHPLNFYTNNLPRMTIDSSGQVGIGTTSPRSPLDVNGNVYVAGGNQIQITGSPGTTGLQLFGQDAAESLIGTMGSQALAFRTNATERLRIDSSGNVGIGMSPSAQLELSTDSAKKPSTNTWTIASDQRLKTNITNADNDRCYEIVKQVPLKRYTWKNEVYSQDKVKDRSKLGWIAQDVEAVFPKAVGTNRFAYNQVFEDVVTPELDSDGNAVLDENGVAKTRTEKRLVSEEVIEDCKDLNSDQIYAAMYGTIQKLIEKVETLEAKAAALEAA